MTSHSETPTSNLVSKLRDPLSGPGKDKWHRPEALYQEAADEIEKLRASLKRIRDRSRMSSLDFKAASSAATFAYHEALKAVGGEPTESLPDETTAPNIGAELQRVYKLVDHWYGETKRLREELSKTPALPKLEYSDHCCCCVRNKITVDVFCAGKRNAPLGPSGLNETVRSSPEEPSEPMTPTFRCIHCNKGFQTLEVGLPHEEHCVGSQENGSGDK